MIVNELKAKSQKPKATRAFTLIELMVVVSIVALFSIITLVSHQKFGDSIAINNLAYDVALTLREAQVYGTSVRTQSLAPEDFDHAYGVRFRMSEPTQYLFFVDLNDSNSYNSGELLNTYDIGRGNYISDLCVEVSGGGSEKCASLGTLNAVHVTFKRPNPDAIFITNPGYPYASAMRIYIKSPTGLEKVIRVTQTGQISVGNSDGAEQEAPPLPPPPTYTWQFQFSSTCQSTAGNPEITPGGCTNLNSWGFVNTQTGHPDGDCPWTVDAYRCLE